MHQATPRDPARWSEPRSRAHDLLRALLLLAVLFACGVDGVRW